MAWAELTKDVWSNIVGLVTIRSDWGLTGLVRINDTSVLVRGIRTAGLGELSIEVWRRSISGIHRSMAGWRLDRASWSYHGRVDS
jgi:hypothetical protein